MRGKRRTHGVVERLNSSPKNENAFNAADRAERGVKQFRRRTLQFERLEGRQMLSGTPPQVLDDTYAVPVDGPLVVDAADSTVGTRITQNVPFTYPGFGAALIPQQSIMMRFQNSDPVRTARVGGVLGAYDPNDTAFAAIVALTGPNDFPDSVELDTPDVLGHTLIPLTDPPAVNSAELSVELSAGWYALVIGGGRLGASGTGIAPAVVLDQNYTYASSEDGWSPLPNHAFQLFVDAVGVRGGVLDNDSDPEGDSLVAAVVTRPARGTLVLDPSGTFAYTPGSGFTGVDSFRYSVSDGTSQRTATAWLGRPHAQPIATNDRYEAVEGQPLSGATVLANDFGENLEAVLVAGPEHGTLAFKADGTFVYTSEPGRVESDRFLYRLRSGTLWSAPATATLDIRDANNAPLAKGDEYRIEPGEILMSGTGGRLASAIYFTDENLTSLNKISIDGGLFQPVRSLTWPASSIAFDLQRNMAYWYIGAPEYRIYRGSLAGGPQQLLVQMPEVEHEAGGHTRRDNPGVRDLAIDAAGGKLYWTSNAVGDYPGKVSRSNVDGSNVEDLWTLADASPLGIDLDLKARKVYWTDVSGTYRTDMDAPGTTETILAGAIAIALDVPHGHIYFAGSQSLGSGGTISRANLDGSDARGIVALHGNAGITDLAVDPARGKVYWMDYWFDTINRVNFDGTGREIVLRNGLTNPYGFTLDQVFPDNYVYGLLANDSDADRDMLTASVARGPQHGRLELTPDGSFKYAPDAGFVGRDTFTYVASDGQTESALATVSIRVGNRVPVANADTYQIREDAVLDVGPDTGILANDTDDVPSSLRAVLVEGPSHGTLNLSRDGSLVYRPDENFFGEDKFTYRADDGESRSNVATVTIRVVGINDPPIARPDQATVRKGQSISIVASLLLENDSDPEGDRLELTAVNVTPDTHGAVALADGNVTYTPAADFVGNASFTYTVRDTNGDEATGTVHVRVEPIPSEGNTAGNANGLGSLDRARRLFNVNVQSRATGEGQHAIQGQLFFVDLESRMFFRSTRITSFRIEPDGRVASFSGVGVLNGRGGFAFTVHVEDRSGPGRAGDRFRIEITGRGLDYDSLDHAINGGRIDRLGDIRVQPRNNVPRPIAQIARGLALAGWANEVRYETLVEQLFKSRGPSPLSTRAIG